MKEHCPHEVQFEWLGHCCDNCPVVQRLNQTDCADVRLTREVSVLELLRAQQESVCPVVRRLRLPVARIVSDDEIQTVVMN